MVVNRVCSTKFWLRPAWEPAIVERNPEKERREGSGDTDDSYNFGRVFHLSAFQNERRTLPATSALYAQLGLRRNGQSPGPMRVGKVLFFPLSSTVKQTKGQLLIIC